MFAEALKEWRRSTKGVSAPLVADTATHQVSMLAPRLFRGIDKDRRLSVLDLGAASGDTVALFSEFRCRLNFVDLLGELSQDDLDPTAEPQRLRTRLTGLLGGADDAPIDICLFWDLLNYLHPTALAAFNAVLAPRLRPYSLAHAYSVRSANTMLAWSNYGFHSTSSVSAIPKTTPALACYPHPPSVLNATLTSLRVERGVLLRDGRLEVLLRPSAVQVLA